MSEFLDNLRNMDDESKKKIKLLGIGLIGFIMLIIIIAIIVAIINRKTSYEDMEIIMSKAAYSYYQDNLGKLPTESSKTSVVDETTLVNGKYMKSIKKYTKDETCKGRVEVTYNNGDFDYQTYLTCNSFTTILLKDQIKKDNLLVTSGAGLYDENGILRFRGEKLNNYLKVKNTIYRIIKIDNEDKIYIIPENMDDNDEKVFVYWDDRYNSEEQINCGINDYSLSRIKDSLDVIYNSLDKELKAKTTNFTACVANRSENDIINTGDIECSKKIENSTISLLPIYEYIRASIAPACQTTSSKECKNYNYMYTDSYMWWSGTGDSTNTDKIYSVNYSGEIDKDRGNSRKVARYVVALKANTLLKEGNGTKKSPYQIR